MHADDQPVVEQQPDGRASSEMTIIDLDDLAVEELELRLELTACSCAPGCGCRFEFGGGGGFGGGGAGGSW